MAITGHIKFFDKSRCLEKDGATAVASSGTPSATYALDQNTDTVWRSSGSNDLTTETYTFTFEVQEISRLFIKRMNLKGFTVKYDVSGVWTDFTSVFGLDGSKANISETAFADNTAYYEFAPVTTGSVQITMTTTQVADQEKYFSEVIVTNEIGTFLGFPLTKDIEITRNNRSKKTLSGLYSIQKSIEVASFDIQFKDYPSTAVYNADMDLIMNLHDREEPFLVWLCGGKRGNSFFKYTLRGFRLQDIYQMQVSKAYKLGYTHNIYSAQVNAKVELEQSI